MVTSPIYPGGRIDQFYRPSATNTWGPIYFEPSSIHTKVLSQTIDNLSSIIHIRHTIRQQDKVSRPWAKENRCHKGFVSIKNKARPTSLLLSLINNI